MLRLVAQGLGIAVGGVEKARLLDLVERRLVEESRGGKRTLLIVDEAQNLPVSALEELRMLSNFTVSGRALVQIFLLGQPEFRDKLAGAGAIEQLRQRVIANHHLDAMGEDEIEAYVTHRLKTVGWNGRPGFVPDAFAAIHRESGGIPRRINQLANRLMLFAAVDGRAAIDAAAVSAVVADMGAEPLAAAPAAAPAPAPEPVLPLRSVPRAANESAPAPASAPAPVPGHDPGLERYVAALEARLAEQEAALRRVLTMLVDWVENGEPGLRSNAA
jgi:hypothetical protein